MPTSRPRLFFATIAAGGGHVAAAKAVMQAVEKHFPDRFALTLSDYMDEVGRSAPSVAALDRRHKEMWKAALRRPWTARIGQRMADAFPRLTLRIERALLDDFARSAASDLERRSVDLVVSTHGLITAGLSLAKVRHGVRTPVLTVATETHNISAYWADSWADLILVPSEAVRRRLQRFGVPADRLEVSGWSVQQAFLNAAQKPVARASLGLMDRFTVLVSLGGEGIGGDVLTLVQKLASKNPAWQFVAVCGRNDALKARLESLMLGNVRVEGFTQRMAEFLAACDVVVGKAGPASVYEALAIGRPILVTSYAGLNEVGLVRMIEQENLGAYLPDAKSLERKLGWYSQHPEERDAVSRRSKALDLPAQTENVARRIVEYFEAVV